jgi:hypothetical protein
LVLKVSRDRLLINEIQRAVFWEASWKIFLLLKKRCLKERLFFFLHVGIGNGWSNSSHSGIIKGTIPRGQRDLLRKDGIMCVPSIMILLMNH